MSIVIVTEKPAVARDIAAVLHLTNRGRHAIEGRGYTVTWALGHLVGIAEPHQIDPAWKQWRAADLPMLPEQWPLTVLEKTSDQFAAVARLLTAPSTERIICATDAGREGELIFRYIYEKSGSLKPCDRLWISSLTPEAIREGLAHLRPLAHYEGLADSARARSRADWLVGMNLSRAYSLSTGQNFSIGRVQTPTLALLVERDKEIRDFVPEEYRTVEADYEVDRGEAHYRASLCEVPELTPKGFKAPSIKRFKPEDAALSLACERCSEAVHRVLKLEEKSVRTPPPQFYDLTELQRHANRLWGFSAQKTLDLAQDLYEKYKLITYPRTDSRHIPRAMEQELGAIARRLVSRYEKLLTQTPQQSALSNRFVDDAQVSDHHAILPTGQDLEGSRLPGEHAKIFDMVCRRILGAYLADCLTRNSEVLLFAEPEDSPASGGEWEYYFYAKGRRILTLGWKEIDFARDKDPEGGKDLPRSLAVGQRQVLKKLWAEPRKTTPPPRLTDASLLTAMEHAGAKVKDKQLAAAMRDHGLGTPATRAAIIETLIQRQYMLREKRVLQATEKAFRLIEIVDPEIKSPQLTGTWEFRLKQIHQGMSDLPSFEADIRDFVAKHTRLGLKAASMGSAPGSIASESAPLRPQVPPASSERVIPKALSTPKDSAPEKLVDSPLDQVLQHYFGFPQFRPHQEAVCQDLVAGKDVLLVMPTGAGKSLCYQLPGLAMGRPTLVISPLIALMDDQVSRLHSLGIAAGAIHSGKSRTESQELCRQYAEGKLPFLYIAPERLGVPGFVPFLEKHKPALVAIDEAHCISNWGHDFRYDYRRLQERLAPLRPAVMVGMTATATQRVQRDIVDQLGLANPVLHVHGFRRTNIAIDHQELSKRDRIEAILDIVKDPKARPAIVYAPTRRDAEQAAQEIGRYLPCAAYHAGMEAQRRSDVQSAFQADRIEIIVATIAFGMGIDKPNVRTVLHLALPSSLEGYYQEIGRAGRDGKPSRAILFASYADIKTHEYFLHRNYPDVRELRTLLATIPETGRMRTDFSNDDLEASIDRLLMIGALQEEHNGLLVRKAHSDWERSYNEQKLHRQKQLAEVLRFMENEQRCRMLQLLDHFGDKDAQGAACGICNVCVPHPNKKLQERPLTAVERASVQKVWEYLQIEREPVAVGRLFRDCGELLGLDRRSFEQLLERLEQQQDIAVEEAQFQKGDELIAFRKVYLVRSKPSIHWDDMRLKGTPAKAAKNKTSSPSRKGATRGDKHPPASGRQRELLERLKDWRKQEAMKRKIPAYCILSDRCLEHIADLLPRDREQLLQTPGIGPVKCEQFGPRLLELVASAR